MSRSPWYAHDPSWWPAIADALPKPWPREAVLADLRYWEDRQWSTKGRVKMPSRRKLAARWGWSDRKARNVLAAESEWRDPGTNKAQSPNRVPTESQQSPNRVPNTAREPAKNADHGSQQSPNRVPTASQQSPHARTSQTQAHSTTHILLPTSATHPTETQRGSSEAQGRGREEGEVPARVMDSDARSENRATFARVGSVDSKRPNTQAAPRNASAAPSEARERGNLSKPVDPRVRQLLVMWREECRAHGLPLRRLDARVAAQCWERSDISEPERMRAAIGRYMTETGGSSLFTFAATVQQYVKEAC